MSQESGKDSGARSRSTSPEGVPDAAEDLAEAADDRPVASAREAGEQGPSPAPPAVGADTSPRQHAASEECGPMPEEFKTCNLCQMEYPRNQFKVLSGGRRASYCTPCQSHVCRGRSRGLSIENLRKAMQDGTLEDVLKKVEPIPPDRKRCQLCDKIQSLENFRELSRGGHESYCRPCNKHVRRGIKRGLHINAVRQAHMVRLPFKPLPPNHIPARGMSHPACWLSGSGSNGSAARSPIIGQLTHHFRNVCIPSAH
jgi:hypothetical protein